VHALVTLVLATRVPDIVQRAQAAVAITNAEAEPITSADRHANLENHASILASVLRVREQRPRIVRRRRPLWHP
jgi:hypothetical protein